MLKVVRSTDINKLFLAQNNTDDKLTTISKPNGEQKQPQQQHAPTPNFVLLPKKAPETFKKNRYP